MKKYKVSFLIPAYNAEKYLEECLQHIFDTDMSLNEYQVIIWNDGSTDGTERIIDDYVSKYPNVIYKHEINQGVAAVRKSLFSLPEGEYIWQCDSDDFLETKNVKFIVDYAIENKLDVLAFDYKSINEDGSNPYIQSTKFTDRIYGGFLWNHLYRTEFIKKNEISFLGDLYTGDDYLFNCQVYRVAKRKSHISRIGCNYRYNPMSLTRDSSKYKNDVFSMVKCFDYLVHFHNNEAKERSFWNYFLFKMYLTVCNMARCLDENEEIAVKRSVSNSYSQLHYSFDPYVWKIIFRTLCKYTKTYDYMNNRINYFKFILSYFYKRMVYLKSYI